VAEKNKPRPCELVSFKTACNTFARRDSGHQGSGHIREMHWYVANRLVLEGGFDPESIKPRPPFRSEIRGKKRLLFLDESVANWSEATVFGGLKTKNVDVVVALDGIGPCIAVSMKGTLNAFRNLTNRMEEAVGDCTNLHIAYPALVYGFLHLIRANREGPIDDGGSSFLKPDPKTGYLCAADMVVRDDGAITPFIRTYHDAISRLAGRADLRDDATRYEAVALLLVDPSNDTRGTVLTVFPNAESVLSFDRFFETLYRQFDLRFVYGAPSLRFHTERKFWHVDSPALMDLRTKEFQVRITDDMVKSEASKPNE
jgi:hypothetical protein